MSNLKNKINFKKYLLVFLATGLVFAVGLYLGQHFEQQEMAKLDAMRADLELDILSSETQFSILETAICENQNNADLTQEQYDIESTLSAMEQRLGDSNFQVQRLKKHYFLLEIKNYLLTKKKIRECDANLIPILYFYKEKKECSQCPQQDFVLDYLKNKYPFLKVYSFDFDTTLGAVKTLKSLHPLKDEVPLLIVDGEPHYGFKKKEDLIEIMSPEFKEYKKEWEERQEEKLQKNSTSSNENTTSTE